MTTGRSEHADVTHFYEPVTSTLTYVVACRKTRRCVIINPVLDLDYASGTITTESADAVIQHVRDRGLSVDFILETHVHADHLTSAPYLRQHLGGAICIGKKISTVQMTFGEIFDESEAFPRDGSQFDRTLEDGDVLQLGELSCRALHVPGHTPACMAYQLGNALFVGDTLFMPDSGTARCDFPGGNARVLYQSIRRLLALDEGTRVFVCHDYQPGDRDMAFESTVGEQRANNIHVRDGITEQQFVAMREARDAQLDMPSLILPSLQVNMRAGLMPAGTTRGRLFFKVPINAFGGVRLDELPSDP